MSLKIPRKHWLSISTIGATMILLWLIHWAANAQIEPRRPSGELAFGFSGASTSDDLITFNTASNIALSPTLSLLPEGDYPYDATMNQAGTQVWLPGASGEGVIVVDAITPTIVQRLPNLGDYPVDIAFSEHGDFAYVSSRQPDDDITIIDASTYITVGTIPVPNYYLGTGKMRTNQCTGELYAVNWYDFHFFVINPISQTVTTEMTFGDNLWDLTIDPTATTLYIADRGTPGMVHVFDIATLTTTTSITVGTDPWGIDITPDGRYVLTANEDSHDVSIIDTNSNSVITTTFLAADADPRDIDINTEGTLAYVTSGSIAGNDGIYVIDLTTFQVVDFIASPTSSSGSNPNVIAVAPDFASLDPIAAFTATTPVALGTAVHFTDTTGNNPTAWQWDFGDDLGNSTQQNPLYNYANPGTYTVTLTTTNDCGQDSIQHTITVVSPTYIYFPFARKGID